MQVKVWEEKIKRYVGVVLFCWDGRQQLTIFSFVAPNAFFFFFPLFKKKLLN